MTQHVPRMGVGELRPSQLMHSFGIGSVVDLPNFSVIVMGLDRWDQSQCRELTEARLLRKVQLELGPSVQSLRQPPAPVQDAGPRRPGQAIRAVGVPVALFPRWFKCPRCAYLAPFDSGVFNFRPDRYRPEQTRVEHATCRHSQQRAPTLVPSRFLVVCEDGHLDDFPWVEFVHRGVRCPLTAPVLSIYDGLSGEPSEVTVRCECQAWRSMADALGDENRAEMPLCRGRRPHLGDYADGGCRRHMKTLLLGASNSWFTEKVSLLSLPVSVDPLPQLVEQQWADLQHATERNILSFLRTTGRLAAFSQYSDDALWVAINQRRHPRTQEGEDPGDILTPEWRLFSRPDAPKQSDDFKVERVEPPTTFMSQIEHGVLVHRLREVSAMVGFTRVDAADNARLNPLEGGNRAPISRRPATFVPAVEVRGEGIFLHFREDAVQAWCDQNVERDTAFFGAHTLWRRKRRLSPESAGYPGLRYVLLHSFSHALMRQLVLECGYAGASIRERIYARAPDQAGGAMAGVLLYTAAPDSEGTLGGLVSLGRPDRLGAHMRQALEQMKLCASDPLCAEHAPDHEHGTLHGAACHACLFAPETSCEKGNRYLDRSVLVDTLARRGVPFFQT